MNSIEPTVPPGLYGKLPAEGDFVLRRLPWSFASAWDAWLQAGLSAAQQQLGERWLDAYLTAPVWRFQLREGVAGEAAWLGLCFASVDRVGRYFPLTMALPMPAACQDRCVVVEADEALQRLQDVALQALDPRTTLAALDEHLASLQPCILPAAAQPGATPLPHARRFELHATAAQVRAACAGHAPGAACFFTWGSDTMPPTLLDFDTLPPPGAFADFLVQPAAQGLPS
jgi:type VI secretion system protein ImpM